MAVKHGEIYEKSFRTEEFGRADTVPAADKRTKNDWFPQKSSGGELMKTANPSGFSERRGYYDIPLLQKPVWKWEIAVYFYLEGISATAYLTASLADLFARNRFPELVRTARYLSLAALVPCPPLLIIDLGRPERFHHMLRVWKPTSPMNLGAWALSGYSLPVGLLAAREFSEDFAKFLPPIFKKIFALLPPRLTAALGIPLAFVMIAYPGVLLSTTSTPVWSRSRLTGALLSASSMSSGAAALTFALALTGANEKTLEKLERIENLTAIAEAAALAAYLIASKDAAEPLTKGRQAKLFWAGAVGAGLIAPLLSRSVPNKSRAKTVIGAALSLAGGLALKLAITYAGQASASSADAAYRSSRPTKDSDRLSSGENGRYSKG